MKLKIFEINIVARRIILLLTCIVVIKFTNGQEFQPMKSPDVTSFVNQNYLPVNESTGKVDITIPIYTIDLDGLSIPISLSYNTGGVKVDDVASRVGLNWTLNAGGLINKEVIGQDDIYVNGGWQGTSASINGGNAPGDTEFAPLGTTPIDYAYTGFGFLRHLLTWDYDPNHPIISTYRDTHPDMYYGIAPSLYTTFMHREDGTPFEISKQGIRIESPFTDSDYLHNMYYQSKLKPGFKFKLTSTNGFVYSFEETELLMNNISTPFDSHSNSYLISNYFNTSPLSENITDAFIDQVASVMLNSNDISYDLYPTTHLSSITNPVTKRKVKFFYEDNIVVDNDRHIRRTYSALDNGTPRMQTNYEHDIVKEKVISKIIYPGGIVNFYYEDGRLDVRGGLILKKIEVRNNLGELIKAAVLDQDYFTSTDACVPTNDHHCYRLRLNAVKFVNKNNNVLPGYSFVYNGNNLPKRYSLAKDFNGYSNGSSGTVPQIYYKANQGKKSYIPFAFNGYNLVGNGDLDLSPNLIKCEKGSLHSITYPTGGYSIFQYELNSFNFLGQTIVGGGLRVKSQTLYDYGSNNIPEKTIDYDYVLEDGTSSGTINNLPLFVRPIDLVYPYLIELTNYRRNKLELSNGSYVTYSRAKIFESNNGYIINEFTSRLDQRNKYPLYTANSSSSTFNTCYNDGIYPNIYQDMSSNRGRLISSSVYDNEGNLIKKTTNEYESIIYETLFTKERVIIDPPNLEHNLNNVGVFADIPLNRESHNYLLKNSTTEEYSSAGVFETEQSFIYDTNLPLLKEVDNIINDSETRKELNYYPFDSEVSSAEMTQLVNLNILVPVKKENYKNTDLLSTTKTNYSDFGFNKILPSDQEVSKGSNAAERIVSFDQYDKRGNIIQFTKENGMTVSILWGYNYQYKIAEILNATYSEVLTALNAVDVKYLQNMPNNLLEAELNNLRTNLAAAQVYTYLHKPGIGPISITDPKELKENYEYDSFKRLTKTRDHNSNITTENEYNYALSPSVLMPTQQSLSVYINKSNTPDYQVDKVPTEQYTLLTAMVCGGRGDYSYEWTESGSTAIIGTSSKCLAEVPCDNSKTYNLQVTDSNGTVIIKTVTVNAPACGEPFYVSSIQGQSSVNNINNFWVNAEGGSYGTFYYKWFLPNGNPGGSLNTESYEPYYDRSSSLLLNTSGNVVYVDLGIRVTDIETGCVVTKIRYNVPIQPEFEINSCFVEGTSITMSDGSLKNIENVVVGDLIMTYNTTSNQTETAVVEEIVSPLHRQLVVFTYANGEQNTNTPDHPYFIKNKGWSSFSPSMTKAKYGLDVTKINGGDTVLVYNPTTGLMEETKIVSSKTILEEQQTYNLSRLSKNNNFFANGVLAHNKSGE